MSDNPLIPKKDNGTSADPAVDLMRAKVARAYGEEPAATQELAEVQAIRVLSTHQRFMQELSQSGKSLAEIQTAWHRYYAQLPEAGKQEVWQEFYAANQHTPYQKLFQKQQQAASRKREADTALSLPPAQAAQPEHVVPSPQAPQPAPRPNGVVVAENLAPAAYSYGKPGKAVKAGSRARGKVTGAIASRVSAGGRLTIKHHLQSLLFGLGTGSIVLVVFLFTFFNEYIIAPFIQPSRDVSSTPIILTGTQTASADAPPSVTIPKINVQIPVDFTLNTYDENTIENDLKSGVIHYPNTVLPGQNGNAAYFGHSSGNIFNNGKYKFAFTLLHNLTTGDLFYITYSGKTYAYQVFDREVVPPTDVGVINDTRGKTATAELITCDPPGISTNRLVVWGEQISPAVSTNTAGAAPTVQGQPAQIADNGPTLWSQFVHWLEFWK